MTKNKRSLPIWFKFISIILIAGTIKTFFEYNEAQKSLDQLLKSYQQEVLTAATDLQHDIEYAFEKKDKKQVVSLLNRQKLNPNLIMYGFYNKDLKWEWGTSLVQKYTNKFLTESSPKSAKIAKEALASNSLKIRETDSRWDIFIPINTYEKGRSLRPLPTYLVLLQFSYANRVKVLISSIKQHLFLNGTLIVVIALLTIAAFFLLVMKPLKSLRNYVEANFEADELVEFEGFRNDEIGLVATDLEETFKRLIDEKHKTESLKAQTLHAQKLAQIGEIAGTVAHEINNPLSIIKMQSDRLKNIMEERSCLGEAEEISFESLNKSIVRCTTIASSLLRYGRLDQNNVEEIDINQMIREVIDMMQLLTFDSKILYDFDFSEEKCTINGDRGKLNQVFVNLLSNAKDALADKGGVVLIKTRKTSEYVEVSIIDNGKGISKEDLKKIFRPYFTTKDVGKGTGLGMGIVQGIIEEMNGSIDVISTVGIGSKFIIKFAIKEEEV